MSMRFGKRILAFAAAAMVLGAATTAQAQEAAESSVTADVLTIESCAENIKSIYKSRYPEQAEMIEEIVNIISADEEFIYIFEQEGTSAFRVIEDSLMDALAPEVSPCAWSDELYYTSHSVAPIRQKTNDFCGPASTVMALVGSGYSKYYYTKDESITNAWQDEVAGKMPETKGHAAIVYEITNIMKDKASKKYDYEAFTIYSYSNAIRRLELIQTLYGGDMC